MILVYISGPVVGNATSTTNLKSIIRKNVNEAKKYAKTLANEGIGFLSPHIHHVNIKDADVTQSQRYYYNLDAELLIRAADALVAIPGWETSNGSKHEVEIAKALELPIFYPKSAKKKDMAEVIKWCKENEEDVIKDLEDRQEREKDIDWSKVVELRRALDRYTFGAKVPQVA